MVSRGNNYDNDGCFGDKSSDGPDCAKAYNLVCWSGVLGAEREQDRRTADPGLDAGHRAGVRDDIAKRIGRTCTHLSDDDFSRLVDEMTDRQLTGERRLNREFWRE